MGRRKKKRKKVKYELKGRGEDGKEEIEAMEEKRDK